ncbi:hypothetical protein SMICM304S_05996 [Streptomyces microflavus]
MAAKIDIDSYVQGVLDGRRAFVARAITLVEVDARLNTGCWHSSC